MKELLFDDNWNGGSFNFSTEEVLGKEVIICTSFNVPVSNAFITRVLKRTGSDGHNQNWENVDYIYELPEDPFDRFTKLLDLLQDGYQVYLKDSQ